jgi:hypothetical protein
VQEVWAEWAEWKECTENKCFVSVFIFIFIVAWLEIIIWRRICKIWYINHFLLTLSIPLLNCSANISSPNFSIILCLPFVSFSFSPLMIFHILSLQSYSPAEHKYPHPSPTDSFGPPLLSAITGTEQYIASHGTIPKCSFSGV